MQIRIYIKHFYHERVNREETLSGQLAKEAKSVSNSGETPALTCTNQRHVGASDAPLMF